MLGCAALDRMAPRALAQSAPRSTADVCVFINLNGAPSHVDTFDFKEGSWTPRDFDPQPGAGGIVLSRRLFPNLLRQSNRLCVLRSVESYEAAHERGQFYIQTGHSSNPAFNSEVPHIGAVIAHERKANGNFPPFLALNGPAGEGAKFLGGQLDPLETPLQETGFAWLEHNFFGSESERRFNEKFALLGELEKEVSEAVYDTVVADHLAFYSTAKRMMYDPAISRVFELPRDDRDRYGNTTFGRSCLVARNAVRAGNGARFISIALPGWDTHFQMWDRGYPNNLYQLGGDLDRGLGSLIEDLAGSGHLDRTLIVAMGEFGRSPGALNSRGGRDHHKRSMFCLMAGGGTVGGRALGETDRIGDRIAKFGWERNRAFFPEDVAATIYSAMGVDYTRALTDTPSGRQFEYVPGSKRGIYIPIDGVFA